MNHSPTELNPLLRDASLPIAFDRLQTRHIEQATRHTLEEIKSRRHCILGSRADDKRGRLLDLDALYDRLDRLLSPVYLLSDVLEQTDLREACQESAGCLFSLQNELECDVRLHRALAEFSEKGVALSPAETRFLKKLMAGFARNGLELDSGKRARLAEIDTELNRKELAFGKNIAECPDTQILVEEELAGLPQELKQAHRREDGTYEFQIKNPEYETMLKYIECEQVRKKLYHAFNNRARARNIPILEAMLRLRSERARILGFDSYAAYVLADTMAEEPGRVWRFLNELSEKVLPKSLEDYEILRRLAGKEVMDSWDKFYYTKIHKQRKHRVADEEIRPYFPLASVLAGAFALFKSLFRIDIARLPAAPTWHPGVEAYQIRENGRLVARFYLDPYSRPNKTGQAACYGIQNGRLLENGEYQIPEAALVLNLSPPTRDRPALLSHQEITSVFHEFGHLLHHLLTRSPLAYLSGSYVDDDFMEMPSQMMESWTWEEDVLRACSAHFETGETIPESLAKGLVSARYLNTGINTQLQIQFAAMDLSYHESCPNPGETTGILRRVQKKYNLYRHVPGTVPQASFNHLVGYAATYYGYLWSRVYASDMFSVFKEKGLWDGETGRRFRETVLASGNTREPMALVEQFLGRPPRMEAYLKSMGFQGDRG